MIDTHCHLTSKRFEGQIQDILEKSNSVGVSSCITQATNLQDSHVVAQAVKKFPNLYGCVGIHPCDVTEISEEDWQDQLHSHLQSPQILALGETGLDYYHPAPKGWSDADYQKCQRDFLQQHFELAAQNHCNIVLHTRDKKGTASFDDALAIAKQYQGRVKPVFHCFPGSWEMAQKILDIGGIVSFTGIVTFPNTEALQETVKKIPSDAYMLETDAPYLAPVPHRGKTNTPAYLPETAKKIAALRNTDLAQIISETTATAEEFFGI